MAVCYSVLQCNRLQCVAVCWSALRCVAVQCGLKTKTDLRQASMAIEWQCRAVSRSAVCCKMFKKHIYTCDRQQWQLNGNVLQCLSVLQNVKKQKKIYLRQAATAIEWQCRSVCRSAVCCKVFKNKKKYTCDRQQRQLNGSPVPPRLLARPCPLAPPPYQQ